MTPNIPRLERLIEVLEHVDRAHFDLDQWSTPACGTTACAVGWAAMDPRFRAEGLELVVGRKRIFSDWTNISATSLDDIRKRPFHTVENGWIWFDGHQGWIAVGKFFGLNKTQRNRLFYQGSYSPTEAKNPDAVIRRIRELIDSIRVVPKLEPEVIAAR